MIQREYTVKGEDVNDFMVMQNFAYLKYTSKLIEIFLLEKGFSQIKLNNLKIGWQKNNDQLKNNEKLMFMERFTAVLEFDSSGNSGDHTKVMVRFYNTSGQLCSVVSTELQWIDYDNWELIAPPKKIAHHFFNYEHYRRAV